MYTQVENGKFRYYSGKTPDIRETQLQSRRVIDAEIVRETNHRGDIRVCPVYDSRLVSDISHDIDTYDYVFRAFAPPGQDVRQYIERYLSEKTGEVIALDVGGPGSEAMYDFSPGFLTQSFGMALTDKRPDDKKARDLTRGHDIIPGDITAQGSEEEQSVWTRLDERLQGKKVDITFIRMGHGNEALPQIPYTMMELLNNVYTRTSETGIIMMQVPPLMHPLLEPWVAKVQQEHAEGMAVRTSEKIHGTYLEIKKNPGAPENIPVLSAREVRVAYDTRFQKGQYADAVVSREQIEEPMVVLPAEHNPRTSVVDAMPGVHVLWRAKQPQGRDINAILSGEPEVGSTTREFIRNQECVPDDFNSGPRKGKSK